MNNKQTLQNIILNKFRFFHELSIKFKLNITKCAVIRLKRKKKPKPKRTQQ